MKEKKSICRHCGNEFQKKHASRRYCSDKCKVYAWHKRNGYKNLGFVKNEVFSGVPQSSNQITKVKTPDVEFSSTDKNLKSKKTSLSFEEGATLAVGTIALSEGVKAITEAMKQKKDKNATRGEVSAIYSRLERVEFKINQVLYYAQVESIRMRRAKYEITELQMEKFLQEVWQNYEEAQNTNWIREQS